MKQELRPVLIYGKAIGASSFEEYDADSMCLKSFRIMHHVFYRKIFLSIPQSGGKMMLKRLGGIMGKCQNV